MLDHIQTTLFNRIKGQIPSSTSLVDELAQVLGVSKDSIYRRIKGEKPLLFDEIIILAKTYGISLDEILNGNQGSIVFHGQYVNSQNFNLEHYLMAMVTSLETVSPQDKVELFYVSKDIPVFYYLMYPEIAAFKFYVWAKSQMQFEHMKEMKLSFNIVTPRLLELSKKVAALYINIPSTEILNADNIINDLRQLAYYKDAHMVENNADLGTIYDKLHEMVAHMEEQASAGYKFLPGEEKNMGQPYKLYVNDFFVGDNTVIAVADGVNRVFINHAAINFIATTTPSFAEYNLEFTRNIIRKSALISEVGERTRSRFFNLIHERIERFRSHTMHSLHYS
jgi:hypothetical protein